MQDALTLDDDVAVALEAEVRRAGEPLQVLMNKHLRTSLFGRGAEPSALPPFRIACRDLVARPGLMVDCVGALLETAEGPLHR